MNNDFGQQGIINKSCQLTEGGGGSGAVNGHFSPLLDELDDDERLLQALEGLTLNISDLDATATDQQSSQNSSNKNGE